MRRVVGTRKAFTFAEMVIVIVIIAILFVTVTSSINFAVGKVRKVQLKNDFRNYQMAFNYYLTCNSGLPPNKEELVTGLNDILEQSLKVDIVDDKLHIDKIDYNGNNYDIDYGLLNTGGAKDGYIMLIAKGNDGIASIYSINNNTGELEIHGDDSILMISWIGGSLIETMIGID